MKNIVNFETKQGKFGFINLWYGKPIIKHLSKEFLYVSVFDYFLFDLKKKSNFKLIGVIENLTEEQWAEIVDYKPHRHSNYNLYYNYILKHYNENAIESGKTLMESLNIYTENPVPKPKEIKADIYTDSSEAYNKVQERVGNWLLIKYL